MLDHHDRVRALGQWRTRHDFDRLTRGELLLEALARSDLPDKVEFGRNRFQVLGSNGETIPRGTMEGRIVPVGEDLFGEHAAAHAIV